MVTKSIERHADNLFFLLSGCVKNTSFHISLLFSEPAHTLLLNFWCYSVSDIPCRFSHTTKHHIHQHLSVGFFFQLNDTSQLEATRKQLPVLSPGLSPAMPHTGSENEMEAARLVCDQMEWWVLSRPLASKKTNEPVDARSPLVGLCIDAHDSHALPKCLSYVQLSVAAHSRSQTHSTALKSLSDDSSQLSAAWTKVSQH